ncbi:hypothetical protein EW145_g8423 [Phellinidium pouzarii]|uniref:Uncharacterized protein n=1 Tax=Phellinidium pouzarii TaxID=167371 RepID=A0A4S4K637_9AGAM|nr:hypothetical protein EW145_g8423 [Phellinidium pouzarii]
MDTSPRSARRMVQPRPQSYASQSPRTHRTRPGIFTRDDIGPRPEPAGASNSAHPNSRFVGQQPHQYEYAHVFMQQQYREQEQLQRLPPSPLRARAHERDLDSKNGEAQTFKADDVLRRRSIPSPRSGYPSRASVGRPHSASPVSTSYSTTRQSSTDAESDDKMDVSRSDAENIGSATASSKRARRTSLYLTIPASASKPASPPPVLFIH